MKVNAGVGFKCEATLKRGDEVLQKRTSNGKHNIINDEEKLKAAIMQGIKLGIKDFIKEFGDEFTQ